MVTCDAPRTTVTTQDDDDNYYESRNRPEMVTRDTPTTTEMNSTQPFSTESVISSITLTS